MSTVGLSTYDSWLEREYQRLYAEGDRFMEWVEANEHDPEEPGLFAVWRAETDEEGEL